MTEETQGKKLFLILLRNNLTQAALAKIMGVNPRTVRRWLQPEGQPGHRKMPPAVWYMLHAELEKLNQKGTEK